MRADAGVGRGGVREAKETLDDVFEPVCGTSHVVQFERDAGVFDRERQGGVRGVYFEVHGGDGVEFWRSSERRRRERGI